MLNFKDWKIASQDGTKATLKHANGHEMTIAMKALPKIQREQIMRLAKVEKLKDGGEVQKFNDDPNVVSANGSDDTNKPSQPSSPTVVINTGSAAPQQSVESQQPQSSAGVYANKPINAGTANAGPIPGTSPNGVLNQNGQPNPAAMLAAGQRSNELNRQANIKEAQGNVQNNAAVAQGYAQSQEALQNVFNVMKDQTDKFAADIKGGKIDPNHFFNQMSAPRQALSGLGLILGGLGAGKLGSTDNPALRFLNQQIDRDIAAQQATINNKKTILGAYQDLFGHGVVATNMARNALLEIYKANTEKIKNQVGTDRANAAYLKLSGDIAAEEMKNMQGGAWSAIQYVPGYQPVNTDTGAMNTPKHAPAMSGQEGPINAQTTPSNGMTTADLQNMHNQQTTEAGAPNGSHDEEDKGSQLESIQPLLKPNSEEQMRGLQYRSDLTPYAGEIHKQYERAKMTDNALSGLSNDYKALIKLTGEGGVLGRLRKGFTPEDVPTGGGDLATGIIKATSKLGGAIASSDLSRLTNSYEKKLVGALSGPLQGYVNDTTLHEWAEAAMPVSGDTPERLRQKLKNFVDLIRDHVPTDKLHIAGISNR